MHLQKSFQAATEASQKQRQGFRKQKRTQFHHENVTPLNSTFFSPFWECKHSEIFSNLHEIQSMIEKENFESYSQEEHEQFISDLFYLVFEHENFKLPKTISFLKNQSPLTASFVAIIAKQIMPNELAYWLPLMPQEDKEIVYLVISESPTDLWYQTWIIHPQLKQYLLKDFRFFHPAARAIKEIVCYKRINPSKLSMKNFTIAQILVQIFIDILGDRREAQSEYFEIAIFVLMSEEEGKEILEELYEKCVKKHRKQLSKLWSVWMRESYKYGEKLISQELLSQIEHLQQNQMEEL